MKNIFIILAMLFAINTSAQSLAEKTGEYKSLYNAVCILYNVKPDSININEGRILMQKYAKSIGLKYELYQYNGGNNLFILYYEPTRPITTKSD